MQRTTWVLFLLLVIAGVTCTTQPPAEPGVLLRFDLATLATSCSQCSWEIAGPAGTPALALKGSLDSGLILSGVSQGIPWHQARYLVADVVHSDAQSDTLLVEFYQQGRPDAPRIHSKMGILPGLPTRVVVPLEYLDGQTFFMARQERRLKGVMPGRRLDPEQVESVRIRVEPAAQGFSSQLWISALSLNSEPPAPLPPTEPVVDTLGQWKAREWAGKTRDEEELAGLLQNLVQSAGGSAFPANWSQYGGWKEQRYRATGYFRTQFDRGRWWLVDPEGYAFFSVGVDVVIPSASGPVAGMEDLHSWLPPETGEFAPAWSSETRRKSFSFLTANWIRVFGSEWQSRWEEVTRSLLVNWRFNTIANWSDLDFARRAKLPYVIPLSGFPTTAVKLYRDFPDVFAPEYSSAAVEFAKQMEAFRDDRFLIGYFLDNEPLWAFGDNNVAAEMLATTQSSHSRQRLVEWLTERYQDDVAQLNTAWNTNLPTLDAVGTTAIPDADALSEQAELDLREFSGMLVDRYIAEPSVALRAIDPNHLNLGIRYASISSDLCYRAGSQFDVFSINAYRIRPEPEVVAEIVRRTGKPVMIGEFHHGSVDRGLPSTGIRGVASQEERGVAYRYYVEQGAALPGLVGIHFFQLNDQPVLGRFDGENYNIGLVDICNRPYPELTGAATDTNGRIYDVVSGRTPAFSQEPVRMPDVYF